MTCVQRPYCRVQSIHGHDHDHQLGPSAGRLLALVAVRPADPSLLRLVRLPHDPSHQADDAGDAVSRVAGRVGVRGRRVCSTVYDARGRAHLLAPVGRLRTLCGRELEPAGDTRLHKSCGHCAELAPAANKVMNLLYK